MRAFGDRVPPWPPLAAAFALGGAVLVAGVAPLLAALPALAAGSERPASAVVLLAAVLSAAGIVALVVRIARLTRPVTAEQLGLRAPGDPAGALGRVLGPAVATAGRAHAAPRAVAAAAAARAMPPSSDPVAT